MPPANPPQPDNPADPFDFLPHDDEVYFEDGFMVFTEAYHLRRGYCCQSGCRHCPYGFLKNSSTPA